MRPGPHLGTCAPRRRRARPFAPRIWTLVYADGAAPMSTPARPSDDHGGGAGDSGAEAEERRAGAGRGHSQGSTSFFARWDTVITAILAGSVGPGDDHRRLGALVQLQPAHAPPRIPPAEAETNYYATTCDGRSAAHTYTEAAPNPGRLSVGRAGILRKCWIS